MPIFIWILLIILSSFLSCGSKDVPHNARIQENSAEATAEESKPKCLLSDCLEKIFPKPVSPEEIENPVAVEPKPQATPPIDWSGKWHVRDGRIIDPNNRVWRGSGANLSNLIDKNESFVRQALERTAREGFTWIRLWGCDHNATGPKDHRERALRVKSLVDLAAEYKLKSMIVLTDEYYGLDGSENLLDVKWFLQERYNEKLIPWIKEIVPLLKDSPHVFAWQVVNEGRAYDRADLYLKFHKKIVDLIRGYDDLHLISPGALSLWHTAHASPYEKDLPLLAKHFRDIDPRFIWTNSFYNFETPAQGDFDILKALGIPLIVTEYGFCQSSAPASLQPKNDLNHPTWGLQNLFNSKNIAGIASWQAGEPDCGYDNPKYPDFNIKNEWAAFNFSFGF